MMGIFNYIFGRGDTPATPPPSPSKGSASAAKERLQIVIAKERDDTRRHDILPKLQEELLDVMRRYFEIDDKKMQVTLQNQDEIQVLEINVELPPSLPGRGRDRPKARAASA
ncbi:cell division topological specificity factor MinE [Marinivivus vitaminiproducens]|uniref:cell division topological specificity factor MinE n=1 Tax=Marinivivus vitaminiproducens TaxID=3035935 RepID=UPI0027983A43|nr:cell division topological specificity factor MinE [Geminicoccaceae bacterium SCSIO 64248]